MIARLCPDGVLKCADLDDQAPAYIRDPRVDGSVCRCRRERLHERLPPAAPRSGTARATPHCIDDKTARRASRCGRRPCIRSSTRRMRARSVVERLQLLRPGRDHVVDGPSCRHRSSAANGTNATSLLLSGMSSTTGEWTSIEAVDVDDVPTREAAARTAPRSKGTSSTSTASTRRSTSRHDVDEYASTRATWRWCRSQRSTSGGRRTSTA